MFCAIFNFQTRSKTEETEQEYEQDVLLASPVIVVYGK